MTAIVEKTSITALSKLVLIYQNGHPLSLPTIDSPFSITIIATVIISGIRIRYDKQVSQ